MGLTIAARYVPMSAVAGDFYDFILVDERRVGLLIADVTGHGVPAALIASMLKVAFAAQSTHADDPARVLDSLRAIHREHGVLVHDAALFRAVGWDAGELAEIRTRILRAG